MTRIVVVDDHPIFRKGLVALLTACEHDVVGEAGNGLEALAVVAETRPDVVLMDVSMPELDGIRATERLAAEHPGVRIVVITSFDDDATVRRALSGGADGYVTKQAGPDQILAAIAAAESGALLLGAGVPRPIADPSPGTAASAVLATLTPRERAIADLVSRGLANPVIAERLFLSAKTVANYVSNVSVKLGATDRAELARIVRAARDG
ncbi:MAG: response regulator transcription factor [Actinobacteria bacterium]|nr:response regulator transcription factor [Actinomycetota bacterium]